MRMFNTGPEEVIDLAFVQEVFSTSGLIYKHCRYLWSEYISHARRKRYLRRMLEELSKGAKTVSELARLLKIDYSIAYKYADELVALGFAVKENNTLHIFNRIFATWVLVRREIPEVARISPDEKMLIRKIKELERPVALAERVASHSFELMAQMLVAINMGRKVNSRDLGVSAMGVIRVPDRARFNLIEKRNKKYMSWIFS